MTDPLTTDADKHTPSEANQALRVLEEMDELIAQLNTDRSQDAAGAKPVAQERSDQDQATQQDRDQCLVESQAWLEQHTDSSMHRREPLDDNVTSLEIQRSKLHDLRQQLNEESQKIAQAWEAIAQGKNELVRQRAVLEADQRSAKTSGEEDKQEKKHSVRDDAGLKRQRQAIAKAWAKLQKEKTALSQERRRLKLQFKSLSEQQSEEPRADRSTKKRLDAYRQQLKEQYQELRTGEAIVDLARQQYTQLLEQRETLVEVKRFLCAYEVEVARRWSVNRSVGLVGGVVSCLLFLLLFSYEVGHRIVDPVWRAGTVVGITSEVLDESKYNSTWLTEQHQLLMSDHLVSEAIRLGAQRGVRLFADVSLMREALSQGLSVKLRSPGRLMIEFRGSNKEMSVNVVKSLGRAFVSHHTMEDRISGRPNSMRIYEAAAIDPFPVKDRRMVASVATLVIASAVVVILTLLLWWWLSHSVYVFEQQAIPELDQLEDDDLWPAEESVNGHGPNESYQEESDDLADDSIDKDQELVVAEWGGDV